MARRNDHSREQIQQMAITAAIGILNEEGPGQLSTRKVASAIGYTVGTLYLVFRNLDELLLHVNAATLDELHSDIRSALANQHTPVEQLKAIAFSYLEFARHQYARWSLLYSHQLQKGEQAPAWFNDKVNSLFGLVEIPLKTVKPDMSHKDLVCATRVLWSGVHGACELALNNKLRLGDEVSAEVLIHSMIDNYLAGLACEQVTV
jgi:AcrR family transcriptional regulator